MFVKLINFFAQPHQVTSLMLLQDLNKTDFLLDKPCIWGFGGRFDLMLKALEVPCGKRKEEKKR